MAKAPDNSTPDAIPTSDRHVPVLLDRCVDLLAPALQHEGAVFVDGTLGMGGHTEAVLRRCPQARAVGIDRDPQALALATERLAPFGDRFTGVHAVSDDVPAVLADLGLDRADAILFDLGVSSLQLDELDRGFAYRADAPLDMRMDQTSGLTAAEVLNTYDVRELERILREFGEERFARPIARAVVRRREKEPFTTSGPLVELLHQVVPAASQRSGGHPAKRTFQALRIEVNAELSVWTNALDAALRALAVDGRIVVLSYHSLEDRITKRGLAAGATSSAPPDLPFELPEHAPWLRLLVRGAEQADDAEVAANPRSASVRLRAAERTRPTPDQAPERRTPDRPPADGPDHQTPDHQTPARPDPQELP
ncbi:16S rRNA (cytosine(1402)-N(4))-methyltransferase RsmH [Ornithinimicrobium tianjinense]|uniref:Ribosomal RNA small subunit methyltransferase H n=1 Tax=Ornithinimicrobium tianjinense TaxID=1195761 RepID=A0A917BHW2_9MICO|nr:16S rRNA (cytosine(1402)-N(4))-methyltransferase RsmH [Ornithinimicrobium tianjinense]GGF44548.1 ribosomal RNA small subunit methyltransferase H [Ornithinimicrobium tianjinense]